MRITIWLAVWLAAVGMTLDQAQARAARRGHSVVGAISGCSDPIMRPCEMFGNPDTARRGHGRIVSRETRRATPPPTLAHHARLPTSQGLAAILRNGAGRAAGLVRAASGATAHVAPAAASRFQCLVDRLEAQGYPVRFMGGWRARGSVRGSLHPRGLALDVNQYGRNRTKPRMPRNEIALAAACGLISGAQWSHGDSGHFQIGGWSGRRGHRQAVHSASHHYASTP